VIPTIIKGEESVNSLPSLSTDHLFGLEFAEIAISRSINCRRFEKKSECKGVALGTDLSFCTCFAAALALCAHIASMLKEKYLTAKNVSGQT